MGLGNPNLEDIFLRTSQSLLNLMSTGKFQHCDTAYCLSQHDLIMEPFTQGHVLETGGFNSGLSPLHLQAFSKSRDPISSIHKVKTVFK